MSKEITFFLGSSPYSSEDTATTIRLAQKALEKGHVVNLIASGDGVYNFMKNQKAKGVPNAEESFRGLIEKGLKVYL